MPDTDTVHVRYLVDDVAASVDFYTRHFGFEVGINSPAFADATRGNLMSLARLNPMERLAGFLVDMAQRRRRQGQDDTEVILPMTRTDIADYLGLTVETVSRSFTRLRQEGSIATDDPHHVRLLNRKRLDALAEARA